MTYVRNTKPTVLTITGSDSTGGAGVQADIKTITALGAYAVSAISTITAQNTIGIQEFYDLPPDVVARQIEAVVDDLCPDTVKVGMLRSRETIMAVAETLGREDFDIVYDPAILSSRGEVIMSPEVVESVRQLFIPKCSLVVLSRRAAQYFLGRDTNSVEAMTNGAREVMKLGCGAVLMQGGCIVPGSTIDVLIAGHGGEPLYYTSPAVDEEVHGRSGTLSCAIAAYMSYGNDIAKSVSLAKTYVNQRIFLPSDMEGRAGELYNELLTQIAKHCKHSSDVAFYAEQLNVTTRYLAQVTRKISGKTPKNLIDEHILRHAEVMLKGSDCPVQEVADSLGFSSQAHFSKFFKKMKGITPSEFRNT